MEALAGTGGMLPEQVWDGVDVPARELFFGRPSGSAMPLVWAHAEYLKLLRSLKEGRIFDLPPQTAQRYLRDPPVPRFRVWRFGHKCRRLEGRGLDLRIETLRRAVIHWSTDGWASARDTETRSTGLGIHVADLPAAGLPAGASIRFTFYWPDAAKWEGEDFEIDAG
jgi:glucoamylase